jgi:hypothetical protein
MLNIKKTVFLIMLFMIPSAAMSTPILFTFESDLIHVDTNPYGISIGDSAILTVTVDNGGVGFLDQSWDVLDIISAEWTSGSYSAFWDSNWFNSSNPQFSTDALGNITVAQFQGGSSSNGADNNGSSAYLYSDGVSTSDNELLLFSSYYLLPREWQVSESASVVSSPSMLSIFALALVGLGRFKRKSV